MKHVNRTNRWRRRAGMTLIEILVVLAIITILVSLSMAAYQRVRITQLVRATESVVEKLQMGVDQQVTIIADNVRREQQNKSADYDAMYNAVGGDADRAKALLMYCRLKQNFPTTAAEVASPSFSVLGVTFNRPAHFAAVAGITDPNPDNVSAALLYITLSRVTQGGNTFDSDAATSGAQADIQLASGPAKVYKDAWINPIPFQRFWQSAELNAPPYSSIAAGVASNDPFDPTGKLARNNWTNQNQAENELRFRPGALPSPLQPAGALFNNSNKAIVVYSYGINKVFDNLAPAPADDVVGYRLRSIARKGDK